MRAMDGIAGKAARHSSRGFSLVEALTGMAVLLVAVLTLIGVVPAAYGFTAEDSVHVQAVAAGQDYLDIIRQYIKSSGVDTNLPPAPVIAIDPGYGFMSNQALNSKQQFSLTPSCSAISLFSFDCVVIVGWDENGATHSLKVESYIASQAGF
jgi:Tfp pilus assembly protein PilV